MTKNEVVNAIRIIAKENGFKTREMKFSVLGINIMAENLNVFIEERPTFNLAESKIEYDFKFRACISRMSEYPTTEELLAVADEIKRTVAMIDLLNSMNMKYEERFEE